MKLYELFITETIPLSKAMKYRRAWPASVQARYEQIFKHYANDDKGFRIYFPMRNIKIRPIKAPIDIIRALANKGYEVLDYVKGLAIDKDNRQMKIGKVIRDTPGPLKKFVNDKRRGATKKEYMTVISRHPYDIAGMSTDRGWTSCMDLVGGQYKRYIMSDVKKGTIIAYLTTIDDPELKNPVGRVLIKPFLNTKSETGRGKVIDFILVRDKSIEGTANPEFKKIVDNWLKEINVEKTSGLYCFAPGLYGDLGVKPIEVYSKTDEELYAAIIKDPKLLQTTKLTFNQLLELLKRKPILINKLTPEAQDKVLAKNGKFIKKMKNPTMDQINLAVRTYEGALKKVDWSSLSIEEIKKIIKSQGGKGRDVVKYIDNPKIIGPVILETILTDKRGDWLSDGWSPRNIDLALIYLNFDDWKKVVDKHPEQIGWLIPGYYDRAESKISLKDKEKLINYTFNKLGSDRTKKIIETLIVDWEVEFPEKIVIDMLNKFPSMVELFDNWINYKLPNNVINKISNHIINLKSHKIKGFFIDWMENDEYIPLKIALKVFNKYPKLFFQFSWEPLEDEEGHYNIIKEKLPKPMVNKLVNYALENMSAYSISMYPSSFLYLKNNISDNQWKKLITKSRQLGFDLLDDVSPELQIWILKNNPKAVRNLENIKPKLLKWLKKNKKFKNIDFDDW